MLSGIVRSLMKTTLHHLSLANFSSTWLSFEYFVFNIHLEWICSTWQNGKFWTWHLKELVRNQFKNKWIGINYKLILIGVWFIFLLEINECTSKLPRAVLAKRFFRVLFPGVKFWRKTCSQSLNFQHTNNALYNLIFYCKCFKTIVNTANIYNTIQFLYKICR